MELNPLDISLQEKLGDMNNRINATQRSRQPYLGDWYSMNISLFTYYADNWVEVDESIDLDTFFQIGDKIKIVQGGSTKYFDIVHIDSTNHWLYLYAGNSYTYTNSAITSFAFSRLVSPLGYPQVFDMSDDLLFYYVQSGVVSATSDFTTGISGAPMFLYSLEGGILSATLNIATNGLNPGVNGIIVVTPLLSRSQSQTTNSVGVIAEGSADSAASVYYLASWDDTDTVGTPVDAGHLAFFIYPDRDGAGVFDIATLGIIHNQSMLI